MSYRILFVMLSLCFSCATAIDDDFIEDSNIKETTAPGIGFTTDKPHGSCFIMDSNIPTVCNSYRRQIEDPYRGKRERSHEESVNEVINLRSLEVLK